MALGAILAAGCGGGGGSMPDARGVPADAAAVDLAAPAADAAPDLAEVLSGDAGAEVRITALPDAAPDAGPDVAADAAPGTMVVGAAGATLTLNEGKLFIRPGALARDTTIVFRTVNGGYPALPGGRAFSSVLSLEPHGQTFDQPVNLTVYHFGGAAKVALYTAAPGGAFTRVDDAALTLNTAEATLHHFSYFVVAPLVAGPDGGADAPVAMDARAPDVAAGELGPDGTTAEASPPPDGDATDTGADAAPDVTPDAAADVAPDAPPDAAGGPAMIRVRGEVLSFDPQVVTIKAGETVTWIWEASNNHSVVSGGTGGVSPGDCFSDGKYSSGVKAAGETFSYTFTKAGTYGYHCAAHCLQFEGGIIQVQ